MRPEAWDSKGKENVRTRKCWTFGTAFFLTEASGTKAGEEVRR